MKEIVHTTPQIQAVTNFRDLVSIPFHGAFNAIGWSRKLKGDFGEIVEKIKGNENIIELEEDELLALQLTVQGEIARKTLLNDLNLLKTYGASPTLNIIKNYHRDATFSFFPTDVYSFHVDRAPMGADTFLCTYYGSPSEIVPNSQVEQKIHIPEVRDKLKKLYQGKNEEFESFLSEYFFDLHYRLQPGGQPIKLGVGHLCRIAVDCPESQVLPCVHRAPKEECGEKRLLLIC